MKFILTLYIQLSQNMNLKIDFLTFFWVFGVALNEIVVDFDCLYQIQIGMESSEISHETSKNVSQPIKNNAHGFINPITHPGVPQNDSQVKFRFQGIWWLSKSAFLHYFGCF